MNANETKFKTPRTLADLKADPRVDWISDERRDGNGWWVYLKGEWFSTHVDCGTIHEDTIKECCAGFKHIVSSWDHFADEDHQCPRDGFYMLERGDDMACAHCGHTIPGGK